MGESQQGRVALVTGGARGLGVEVCRQLAQLFTPRIFNGTFAHAITNTTACSAGFLPNK